MNIIKYLTTALILLAALAALIVGFFEFEYRDRYYPGVAIAGEPVGGKTYNEVFQGFKAKSDALSKNGLTLVLEREKDKKEINIPVSSSGFTSDILVEYFSIGDLQGVVSRAYSWGRQGSIIQRFKEQIASISGKNFASSISLHKEAVLSLLARETKYFFTTGEPAQFSLDENNDVAITPEKLGDDVDTEKIADAVIQKLNSFEVQPIVFKIQPKTPYPTEIKLKPFLGLAKEIAKSVNANFYYQDNKWKVSGKKLATWLTLNSDNKITVDGKKLETFLSDSVVPLINDPPENSRFEMKDGSLVEISPGKPGEVVNVDKTAQALESIIYQIQLSFVTKGILTLTLNTNGPVAQLNQKTGAIDIPIETIKMDPQITQKTIDKYKIKDRIGYATTNFTGGSLDRQHNIEVGVSKLTGILIAPGEEFSTVWNIGDISEEAGFVKEYVIKGDQTVKELGGGLCQVATTLFRTALNAGLPITERINHEYVIPYYGPGLDATIYGPHPDFRFVNDTDNYVLLQGTAKNNEVTFELYGVSDGRTIEISKPALSNERPVPPPRYILNYNLALGKIQCQTATHKGITADVTYTVNYLNGPTKEQTFHSVYRPWPEVCYIGAS